MKKVLIAFFATFIFTQICGIYIVGGLDEQTIDSKFFSIFFGVVFGIFSAGFVIVAENLK